MNQARFVVLAIVALVATLAQAEEHGVVKECNARCRDEKSSADIDSCQMGCRLYSSKRAEATFSFPPFIGHKSGDPLVKCTSECDSDSCRDGCQWMKECCDAMERNGGGGGFRIFNFGNIGNRLPDMVSRIVPAEFDMPSMPTGIKQMVDQVHQIFNDQIKSGFLNGNNAESKNEEKFDKLSLASPSPAAPEFGAERRGNALFSSLFDSLNDMMHNVWGPADVATGTTEFEPQGDGNVVKHSGGKLVVINSGPGVYSKKEYRIGPGADLDKLFEAKMDDMMNHMNPMEQYFQKDDVELFNPEDKEAIAINIKDNNAEIEPADMFFDKDPWGLLGSAAVADNNEALPSSGSGSVVISPKLPETGLISRHFNTKDGTGEPRVIDSGFIVVDRDICSQDRSQMTWGDWFTCLHIKMGVPNWLLVATVALGVIFTLWLCLAIPSSAPRQKIRKPKMVATKEMEANGVATIMVMPPSEACDNKATKVDLPPSYEDIVSTRIESEEKKPLEPVHDFKAAAASAGHVVVLEDDDEIVEPLPEKADLGGEEERNCSNV